MLVKKTKEHKKYLINLKNEINAFEVSFRKRYKLFPYRELTKIKKFNFDEDIRINIHGNKFNVNEALEEISKRYKSLTIKIKPSYFNYVLKAYIKASMHEEGTQIKKQYTVYHNVLKKEFDSMKSDLRFCLDGLKEINKVIKNNTKQMNESFTLDELVDSNNKFIEGTHQTGLFRKLYHISPTNLDGKVLHPRVPVNKLTKNGIEDGLTARVCFAPTIDKCLMALSDNLKGKEFFVHVPVDKTEYIDTTKKDVPDAKITKEKWVTMNVELKCVGKIKVFDAKDKKYKYKCGTNESKKSYLYKWNWKYDEKFVTESVNTTILKNNTQISLDVKTPEALSSWMKKNIKYDNSSSWKLRSPEETFSDLKGNCHDQSLFASYMLKKMKNVTHVGQMFLIEFKGERIEHAGNTHTLTYFFRNGSFYWFENSWKEESGIHGPYGFTLLEMMNDVRKKWKFSNSYDKLYSHKLGKVTPGMNLNDYCNSSVPDKELKEKDYYQKESESEISMERLIITLEDGSKVDYNDFMLECVMSTLENVDEEEILTEGTNLDNRKVFKASLKTVKTNAKLIKKNLEQANFIESKKLVADNKKELQKAKKIIEKTEGDVESVVLGWFANNLIDCGKMVLVGFCGGTFNGLTYSITKNTIAFVIGHHVVSVAVLITWVQSMILWIKDLIKIFDNIHKKDKDKKIEPDDLNMYKAHLINAIDDLSKKQDKILDVIKEAEKQYKVSQKKEKTVKESAEFTAKKLDIYKACNAGDITIEEREELLEDLRAHQVVQEATNVDSEEESLTAKEKYEKVRAVLYERCNVGLISVDQREELLLEAYDQIFETTQLIQPVSGSNPANNQQKPMDGNAEGTKLDKEINKGTNDFKKQLDAAMKDTK